MFLDFMDSHVYLNVLHGYTHLPSLAISLVFALTLFIKEGCT